MKKRVLCLSGGGAKGVLTTTMLCNFQKKIGVPLHEFFDIIIGTSTGAIIGSMLAAGIEIQKIHQMYVENLDKIKKFNLEIRYLYKNGTPEQIEDKINQYVKFPWELDAYISTEADEVFEEIKKKSRSKKDALYYLKNIKPTTPNQKVYKENEKLWKRFILHINKLIERDFRE